MTPWVSVVIAARDAEGTLGVQLAALAAQRCPVPWNVVVSDNGSRDRTVEVARRWADRLPGLVVVDSSGRPGAGAARNVGVEATTAPLLVFCDADDEVAPGWLAAIVAALDHDRFVAGRFEATRLNGPRERRSRTLAQDDRLQESPFGPGLPHAGAGNLGVHRDVFLGVGGFDPGVGCLEDTDLCWRVQLSGVPLTFHPEAVVHVRLRSSLRAVWAQGRAYGRASALLTHRFRAPAPTGRAPAGPADGSADGRADGSADGRAGGRSPWRRLARLLAGGRDPGAVLWTLAWHVGHRGWRPRPEDGPAGAALTPAGRRAADAA